jgi:MEMO1 family protein
MGRTQWVLIGAATIVVAIVGVGLRGRGSRASRPQVATTSAAPVSADRVQEPNVAGKFYPADPDELGAMIDGFLSKAHPARVPNLRALVCPHAGYPFSGPTAAYCYQILAKSSPRTVAILAPSHRARFLGVSVPAVDAFRTPLGLVFLSDRAARIAAMSPFNSDPSAHASEHSLEVQLPFLLRVDPNVRIVPMVFGEVDEAAVGRRLAGELPDGTVVVASSDLSHYHPYDMARQIDRATIDAILALDPERVRRAELCGKGPVLALLAIASQKGWQAQLIDYRNSGDTAGDKGQVVGYAAIAFFTNAGTHG